MAVLFCEARGGYRVACIIVDFTCTFVISTYHHYICEWKGVLDNTLCDNKSLENQKPYIRKKRQTIIYKTDYDKRNISIVICDTDNFFQ